MENLRKAIGDPSLLDVSSDACVFPSCWFRDVG
jgi:hypothetical protein